MGKIEEKIENVIEVSYDLEGLGLEGYFLIKEYNTMYIRNKYDIWYKENILNSQESNDKYTIENYEGKILLINKEQKEEIFKLL